MSDTAQQYVISVSSAAERDISVRQLYTNLTKEPLTQFTVDRERVDKICVYHNVGPGIKVLIRTYLFVLVPVNVNIQPLQDMTGKVYFHLNETITKLEQLTTTLRALNGPQQMRNKNDKTLGQLVNSLC